MYLFFKELRSSVFTGVIVVFVIFISFISFAFFETVDKTVNEYMNKNYSIHYPPDIIRVSATDPIPAFPFNIISNEKNGISDNELKKIKGITGVKKVYPVLNGTFPLHASASFLGFSYGTDISCSAVPFEFIKSEIPGKYRKIWKRSKSVPVPVLVPELIFRAYNEGMAKPNRLPRINAESLRGRTIYLTPGSSSVHRGANFMELKAVIAGVTEKINGFTLVMPYAVLKRLNRDLGNSGITGYQELFVSVDSHDDLVAVRDILKEMKLKVETNEALSESVLTARKISKAIFMSIEYIILILAATAISFTVMIASTGRIEYYRLLRVMGMSKVRISMMVIGRYFCLWLIGIFMAWKFYGSGADIFFRFMPSGIPGIGNIFLPDPVSLIWPSLGILCAALLPTLVRLYRSELSRG